MLAPLMVSLTLHDDWALFAGVLATPAIAGGLHLVRGLLGGTRRFGGYAATLAVEGGARLLLTMLLAVAGIAHAWIYGAGYLAASVIAIVAGLAWLRRTRAVETADTQCLDGGHAVSERRTRREGVGWSLAALAVATLFAQLLPNLAPLVVTSRLAQDSVDALAFGQAAVIARIPLLLFFPIQTMLLPSMSAAVARRELGVVARRVRLTLAAVGAVGAVSTLLFVLLGRWVLRTFFDTAANLSGLVMLLLAVSTVVLIAAYAAQPALVALHRDRVVTAGWAVGSAITLALALLPADPLTTASVAQVVGPTLTLGMVLLGLHAALRSPEPPSACPPFGTHETADTGVPNGGHAGVGGGAGSAHSA
jgi:O-antigen/teichoic acid export membrane protein